MASEIRVDKINSLSGVGTVTLSPTGVDIAGITTVATFKVGTGVTASSDGDIFATGVCTATSFVGSGANLTGVASTENIRTNTNATFLQNVTVVGTSTVTGNIVPSSDSATDIGTNSVRFQNAYVDTYYGDGSNLTGIDLSAVTGATGDFSIADKIVHTGDTDTAIRFPAADSVRIDTAGSNRFKIDSNGRIGILDPNLDNFDSSADDLVINGAANTGITINSGGTSSTAEGALVFAEGNGSGGSADGFRGAIQYKHGDDRMMFYTNNGERLRILAAGGLTFNGDTATANALDDYEEGTFTAGCANGVTLHSNANQCSYTKIGRVVTVRGQVRINSDNGTSDLVINNLPFTNYDSDGEDSSLSLGAVRLWDFNLVSDAKNAICLVVGQNTNLEFWYNRDDASSERLDADSNAYIAFTVTYFST